MKIKTKDFTTYKNSKSDEEITLTPEQISLAKPLLNKLRKFLFSSIMIIPMQILLFIASFFVNQKLIILSIILILLIIFGFLLYKIYRINDQIYKIYSHQNTIK